MKGRHARIGRVIALAFGLWLVSCRRKHEAVARRPAAPHALPSAADTLALYDLSDTGDSSKNGLTLKNLGGVLFTAAGLDWSEQSNNAVARFNGGKQSLSRAGLSVGQNFSLEARLFWRGFKRRPCGAPARVVALLSGDSGFALEQRCGAAEGLHLRVNRNDELLSAAELEELMDNQWHTLRFVVASGSLSFFVDGTQLGSSADLNGLGTANWVLTLGDGFDGDIDQVRLSRTAQLDDAPGPTVSARPAYQELTGVRGAVSLSAAVSGGAKLSWSVLSGPGAVVFGSPSAADTTATFSVPGKYVLEAAAFDGVYSANDYVVVRVWPETGRSAPYKTLFIGNSFSFYNGTVGYRFWQFAKQAGESVGDSYRGNAFVSMLTSPGKTLRYHWYEPNSNDECTACVDHVLPAPPTANLTDYAGAYATDVIRNGAFDVVFLQGYSDEPATDALGFARMGRKLDRLIKRSGARTVFFQTWAYPGGSNTLPEEGKILSGYEQLARQTGAALSPVGRAFEDARSNANGYAAWPAGLLFSENKHPSSFGTYVIGALSYAAVYGKSAASLAVYPEANDIPAPAISSDRARADRLRALAARFTPSTPLAPWK